MHKDPDGCLGMYIEMVSLISDPDSEILAYYVMGRNKYHYTNNYHVYVFTIKTYIS